MNAPTQEEIAKRVAARALSLREKYNEQNITGKSNVLVYGDFGTGKTTFLATSPRPIWVHNFDPGGMSTASIQPLIQSGDIIVTDFTGDSMRAPSKFLAWEREMSDLARDGVFPLIGTFVIDSLTKWADAMMNELVKRAGFKNDGIPQPRDYMVQQLTSVDWLGKLCSLPCNIICTGHIGLEKDEVTGALETGLNLAGKLSTKVPLIFDEKWLTRAKATSGSINYTLQTRNDGYYKAETRMGGGKFDQFEEPNFRALLIKAGRTNAAQDKPRLFPAA